jgi:general secretion pathway protein K
MPGDNSHHCGQVPHLRGFALIAVLWMVSALTILVSGLILVSRGEVQETEIRLQEGRAVAMGDAAIQMAVRDWMNANPPPDRLKRVQYVYEGAEIEVEIVPGSGYINLNNAPEELLQALFVHAAGQPPLIARHLAQSIIDWRDTDDEPMPQGAEAPAYQAAGVNWRPRNDRFSVPEDLLQVLGIDFELFTQIEPFVTVWSGERAGGASRSGVNPMAAPEPMLFVLCSGNLATAARIAASRDAGESNIDTTTLEQSFLRTGAMGNIVHILASVPVDATGRRAVRARWVLLRADEDGTPWQTIRAEPVRFVATHAN